MRWKLRRTGGRPSSAAKPRNTAKGRSSATEFFFQEPGGAPVILVCHISKTAGTALRRFVRANLADAETEVVHNLRYVAKSPAERLRWFRAWYAALDDDRRARLSCVMSHWAGYLLPALDRPVDALTLVREPVDRTLSYYFHKQRQHPEWSLASLERLGERRSLPDWREAPEHDLLDRLFNNWQSRALLSVFHDVSTLDGSAEPSDEANLWRERLRDLVDRLFLVGVQDRFEEYVDVLARRYGWPASVPQAKINPQRPSDVAVSPGLRDAILGFNWLDRELHELARQKQQRREAKEGVGW
jgi:hypothetical protein